LVEAIIRLMSCDQAVGRIFNIGTNEEISIEELADKVIEMTDSKSKKQFVSYEVAYGRPIEDMMRRVPSLERIKEITSWEPGTNLDEILKLVIEYEKLSIEN
jgi:UDP-glucose 4-epimerase